MTPQRVPGRPRPFAPPPSGIEPPPPWQVGPQAWDFRTPVVLGVLNTTPDSFSDGGAYVRPEAAVARAHALHAEGADVIDVGGASSHPSAAPTPPEVERKRVVPVVERLLAEVPLPISIDTQEPGVADACLRLGAHLVNDVSGLTSLEMAGVAATHDVPLVVTYNNLTVPKEASGLSFVSDMLAFFHERVEETEALGVRRVILDPGYGFGKTLEENLAVLRTLPLLRRFNRPILACTSRKGSLGALTGEAVPRERVGASIASTLYAITQGANVVRVHDVKPFRQALTTWLAFERFPRD